MKSDTMHEHFVGYLLGSLDPVTHARVEAHLKSHPEDRERLRLLEEALAPLADDAEIDPPPGLAVATLARVAEYRCALPAAPKAGPIDTAPRRAGRRADWIAAAAVLLLAGGVALPFFAQMLQKQQRVACANNLRKFAVALAAYADRGDGEFPRVEREGALAVAGVFMPVLTDAGLARDVRVSCPAQPKREPWRYRVADLERMHAEAPELYHRAASELAGHYAYSLGYQDNGRLRGLRRDSGDSLPILADRSEAGENSGNHDGRGQNVLYVGGHVRWAVQPTVGEDRDHIYVNHLNRVGAGVCRVDSVLGASDARPFAGE
jgi:hypothetical protein